MMAQTHESDLIILDVNMADMSGLDVLAFLREDDRFRTIPIVMLTGDDDPRVAEAAKPDIYHCDEACVVGANGSNPVFRNRGLHLSGRRAAQYKLALGPLGCHTGRSSEAVLPKFRAE